MGLIDLFVVSLMPVLKLLLVASVGSVLAMEKFNILNEDARKHLNNVVFYVCTPALIEMNLAETVTLDSMVTLWFMPINILLTFIVGSIFGWIVIKITSAPSNLKGLIIGCCSAGNLGNLILIIIPVVCREKGNPFGAPDKCHTYGMAYASLSLAISAVYIWLYVYNVMRGFSSQEVNRVEDISINTKSQHPLKNDYDNPDKNAKVSILFKFKQQFKTLEKKIDFKRLFSPSTIAAIIGFIIGIIPQLRNILIGETAYLRVIQDSASLLSEGAIPVMTLILGGNLINGLKGSGIKVSLIIWIIVVRYIILPMSGILIVKIAIHLGLIQSDPLYHFVLLLQYSLPPAMAIGVIVQMFGEGESECSLIMLWTYLVAPIALTLWSTVFMWMVS